MHITCTKTKTCCAGPAETIEEYYKAKSGAKRPKLQDLTVAQWGLANTRIMNKLVMCNGTYDQECAHNYLAYTVKVFEMFGKFERVVF